MHFLLPFFIKSDSYFESACPDTQLSMSFMYYCLQIFCSWDLISLLEALFLGKFLSFHCGAEILISTTMNTEFLCNTWFGSELWKKFKFIKILVGPFLLLVCSVFKKDDEHADWWRMLLFKRFSFGEIKVRNPLCDIIYAHLGQPRGI